MPEHKALANPPEEGEILNEDALVLQCQQGRLEAYEPLVKKYQSRLCAHAYQFVRNEVEAEELAQIAFVKAWQKIKSFNRKSTFYTWLYRLCTNVCLDHLRKRNRRKEDPSSEPVNENPATAVENREDKGPGPDELARNRELQEAIDQAIKQLSPDHQVVIVMREIQGYSYEEIAETVGCSVGTVMSRLFYARRYLREKLVDLL